MMDVECPQCRSPNIEVERQMEYTGGGYADYWDEYYCIDCSYEWRGEKDSGYA